MGLFQATLQTSDLGNTVNLRDGLGTAITSTTISSKQALDVNIAGGMLTVGTPDETAFTYGTSTFLPIGGVFNSSVTALNSGQSGAVSLTAQRAVWANLRNSTGTEIGNNATNAIFNQDQTAFSATPTLTQPTLGVTSGTLLASNSARKGFSVYNNTLFVAYVAAGATSSLTAYSFPVAPHTLYEPSGRWVATSAFSVIGPTGATGTLQVTEYT